MLRRLSLSSTISSPRSEVLLYRSKIESRSLTVATAVLSSSPLGTAKLLRFVLDDSDLRSPASPWIFSDEYLSFPASLRCLVRVLIVFRRGLSWFARKIYGGFLNP